MHIIFLGGFFPKEFQEELISNSKITVQNSSNNFQRALIDGLVNNLKTPLTLVSAPFIGWFPKYYKQAVLKGRLSLEYGNPCHMIGFLNLPVVKNLFKTFNLTQTLKKVVGSSRPTTIIVYSIDTPYLQAALAIKRKNSQCKVCVIVPDLHEFPGDAGRLYKWYLKYVENPIFHKLKIEVDSFVFLTDKMPAFLGIQNKPWVLIEGLFKDKGLLSTQPNRSKRIILYAGTLDKRYGVRELVQAFRQISYSDYELWICGGGGEQDYIIQNSLEDTRIKFYGLLTAEKVWQMQQQATLLVNPRTSEGEYNKYTFPSKVLEYFASGVPVLMYKLDGIPAEYFSYCYTLDDNEIQTLTSTLINVSELPSELLKEMGERARRFILTYKNETVQAKKLLDLILRES